MQSKIAKVNNDRTNRHDDIVASGATVEMRFQKGKPAMSLRAAKLFHMLVKNAGGELDQRKYHQMTTGEISRSFYLDNDEIKDLTAELVETFIEIIIRNANGVVGKENIMQGNILSNVDIEK